MKIVIGQSDRQFARVLELLDSEKVLIAIKFLL